MKTRVKTVRYKSVLLLLMSFCITSLSAQEKLLSFDLPNGTTNITGEYIDEDTGYKLVYNKMRYLENRDDKSYYQFHSGDGSFVMIEVPAGEYFKQGDIIKIDTYVNRGSNDFRSISIYDKTDYTNGGIVVGTASAQGGIATVYDVVLNEKLPNNTSVLYLPATSSINSYISIHGVEIYGNRAPRATLASLTLNGTNQLYGNTVDYMVDAFAENTTVSLNFEKEEGKDVTLSISSAYNDKVDTPADITNWESVIPTVLSIPVSPGSSNYYYIRSTLSGFETVYYEIIIARRNSADVIYNYDLTVNPIVSNEDPELSNIENTAGYHSSHGWRFNYASGSTLKVKVTGDAIIKLRGCGYNNIESKVTATVENTLVGEISPNYNVTPIPNCNGYNNFYYAGESNTITFTYSGVAFVSYITIINEGSNEKDLRSIFIGESELSLNDFVNNEYTFPSLGFVEDPTSENSFSPLTFCMKKGVLKPNYIGGLDTNKQVYTYTFVFDDVMYKVNIPYETEVGYVVNEETQSYDITTSYGLKTVVKMLNDGTALYKKIYLPNGIYDLGDIDGSYQYGVSLTADNVIIEGESHESKITGKYRGVTSAVVQIKGANTVVRNLTIESLVGNNGVAPALIADVDNILFDNIKIISWQDTYVGGTGRHLFNKCVVVGSVDFICNGANAIDYFLHCDLQLQYRNNGGYITAPQGKTYFRDCIVSNAPDNAQTMNKNFSLARPWRETGHAFFINTIFDILPKYGFVTMSGNLFQTGCYGTIGNVNVAKQSIVAFDNDASIPVNAMTQEEVEMYSSIYKICGSKLASMASELIAISTSQYTTLFVSDALLVPTGVTAYAITKVYTNYVEISEAYSANQIIPAFTPIILNSNIDEDTSFIFEYIDNSVATRTTSSNMLRGDLVHNTSSNINDNYYLLTDDSNGEASFSKQDYSLLRRANVAYLLLNETEHSNSLTLSNEIETSIINQNYNENEIRIIYDLQGCMVQSPEKGKIYIINGKKRIYFK